jgi:hypothetical protein
MFKPFLTPAPRQRRRFYALAAPFILLLQPGIAGGAPGAGLRIPTAAQIRLRYASEIGPAAHARAMQIYDRVRARLLAERFEPRVVIGILSDAADGGLSAFVDPRARVAIDARLPRPSVAEELCDASRLARFGSQLGRELGAGRARVDVIIDGEPPSLLSVVGSFPGRMSSFYGVARDRKGSCSGRPFQRASAPVWRVPVRIAATGSSQVDSAVRAALETLRRDVPGLPIDDSSFGAAPAAANFWLGDPAVPQRSVFFAGLNGCIREGLCSLSQIAGARGARGRGGAPGATLRTLFLSRPYDQSGRANAIVQVDSGGGIAGAACGSDDYGLGQAPAPAGGRAFHPEFVILCLAQGLGAVPGALTDAAREWQEATLQSEISESVQQLRILYQNK